MHLRIFRAALVTLASWPLIWAQGSQTSCAASRRAALWNSVKRELLSPRGPHYFETSLKDAFVPGGANGVDEFTG